MHTAATFALLDENNNGQQASGQMCHQIICTLMQDKKQSQQVHSPLDFYTWGKINCLHNHMYSNWPTSFELFFGLVLNQSFSVVMRLQ